MSKYPPFETRSRIKKWCDLQERAHSDVSHKLKTWGLTTDEIDQIIAELISENYLNEERFARAFASGKFRIKNWGWQKIKNTLIQKGVSEFSIEIAKNEIDTSEYESKLSDLLRKKWPGLKGKSDWDKKQKLLKYAYSKGYEPSLVQELFRSELSDLFS